MKRRKGYNPKRRVAPLSWWSLAERRKRAADAQYGGNPEHKLNPAKFGLGPAINPRPGKTLCDAEAPFSKEKAERLLREGFSKGMISEKPRDGWPQNVWAVSEQGQPFEAQLENPTLGVYHGYPMPQDDDFRTIVIEEWKNR